MLCNIVDKTWKFECPSSQPRMSLYKFQNSKVFKGISFCISFNDVDVNIRTRLYSPTLRLLLFGTAKWKECTWLPSFWITIFPKNCPGVNQNGSRGGSFSWNSAWILFGLNIMVLRANFLNVMKMVLTKILEEKTPRFHKRHVICRSHVICLEVNIHLVFCKMHWDLKS